MRITRKTTPRSKPFKAGPGQDGYGEYTGGLRKTGDADPSYAYYRDGGKVKKRRKRGAY
jgi:hypothetical protein